MTEVRILSGPTRKERSWDSRRPRCLVCRRRFASSHLLLLHKRRGHCATEALRRRVREDRRPKRLPAASAGRSVLPEPSQASRKGEQKSVTKKAAEPPRHAEASPRMACDDCGEQFDGLRHLAHHSTVFCRQESQRRRFGRKVAVEPRLKSFAAAKRTAALPPSPAPRLKPAAKVLPSPAGSRPLLREKAASVAGPPQAQSGRGGAGRSEKRDALVGKESAVSKAPLKSRWSKRRDHQISNGLLVAKEPEQIHCDECGGSFGGLQLLVWHVKFRCNAEKSTKSSASAGQLGTAKVPFPQKKRIASVLQIKPAKTITPVCRKKVSRLYTAAATRTGRASLRVTATTPEQFMCDSCGGSFAKLQLLVRHVMSRCSAERSAKAIERTTSMRRKKALPLHAKSLSARMGGTSDNTAQRPRLKLLIDHPRVIQGRQLPQKPAFKLEAKLIREKAVLRTTESSAGKVSSMLMKHQVSPAGVASAPSAEERSKSSGSSICAEAPAAVKNKIRTKRAEEPTTQAKPQSKEPHTVVPVAPNAQVAQLSEPSQGPEQNLISQAENPKETNPQLTSGPSPFEVAASHSKMERASDEGSSVASSPSNEVLGESEVADCEPFRAPSPSAIGLESASEPWSVVEPFTLAPEIAEAVRDTSAEKLEIEADQGSWQVDQSMPANAPEAEAKMEPFRAPSPAEIGLGGGEEGSEGGSEQCLSPFRLQPEDEDQEEDHDWKEEQPHSPSAPANDCLEAKRAFVRLKKLSSSFIANFMEQKRQNELPSGSFSASAVEMIFAQPIIAAPENRSKEASSILASDGIYMTAPDGDIHHKDGQNHQIGDAAAEGTSDEPYSSDPILAPFSMAGLVAAAGDLTPPQPESFPTFTSLPSSAAAEGPEEDDDDLPDVVPELELLEEGELDLVGDGQLELEEEGPLGDDSILILPRSGGASGQSLVREAAPDQPGLCGEPRAPLAKHASQLSSQAPSAGSEALRHDKDGGQVEVRNTVRNAPKSKHPLEMEEINDDSEDSLLDLLDD